MLRKTLTALMTVGLLAVAAQGLDAQVRFGGQLNIADETDVGLGPRIALDLGDTGTPLQVVGTWDIYFPDEDALDYWELNGNLVYRFELEETDAVVPYGGGGLNVARFDVETPGGDEVGDTEVGVNFLGGVEFPLVSLSPFVEFRVTAEGGEQFYVTGGVLVP